MTEIKIMEYLDAKEERLKALEVLKEKKQMNSSWKLHP